MEGLMLLAEGGRQRAAAVELGGRAAGCRASAPMPSLRDLKRPERQQATDLRTPDRGVNDAPQPPTSDRSEELQEQFGAMPSPQTTLRRDTYLSGRRGACCATSWAISRTESQRPYGMLYDLTAIDERMRVHRAGPAAERLHRRLSPALLRAQRVRADEDRALQR